MSFVTVAVGSNGANIDESKNANAKDLYTALSMTIGDNPTIGNYVYTTSAVDKVAGIKDRTYSGDSKGSQSSMGITSPTAIYFYDKSTNDNSGITGNGNTFTFNIQLTPEYVSITSRRCGADCTFSGSSISGEGFSTSGTFSSYTTMGDKTATNQTLTITGTNSSTGAMTGSYTTDAKSGNWSTSDDPRTNLNIVIPFKVNVIDKSSVRNAYATATATALNASDYTTSSWSAFTTALENAQQYLNNVYTYDNSTQGALASALTTAYNALDKRADLTELTSARTSADTFLLTLTDTANCKYSASQINTIISAVDESAPLLANPRDVGQKANGTQIAKLIADLATPSVSDSIENYITATQTKYDKDRVDQTNVESVISANNAQIFTDISYSNETLKAISDDAVNNIDGFTSSVLSAVTSNTLTYTLTFPSSVTIVSTANATVSTADGAKTVTLPYGASVSLEGVDETAWYMKYQSKTVSRGEQYQTVGSCYNLVILGDTTVTIQAPSDAKNKITMIRSYDVADSPEAVQWVKYIDDGFSYQLESPTQIPNYTFTGYTVDGEAKSVGDIITPNGEVEIKACYSCNTKFNVTLNGASADYSYNAKIIATTNVDSGNTVWVEKAGGSDSWRVFGYGNTISFRVSESTVINSVSESALGSGDYANLTAGAVYANARISGTMNASGKITFIGQYVAPSDVEVVECGILVAKSIDGYDIQDDDIKLENISTSSNYKLLRCKSTNHTDANQFAVAISNLSGSGKYKAYATYKVSSGNTVEYVTVYSDVAVAWSV
jgi:hypothetical protein